MKNSTKMMIIFSALLFTIQCQLKKEESAAIDSIPAVVENKSSDTLHYLGNHLYEDSQEDILLKVKNRPLLSPSLDLRSVKDSIFLGEIYNPADSTLYPLKKIADVKTFRQINNDGCYFQDTTHVFVYVMKPVPVQFYFVDRIQVKFLGKNKNYMRYKSDIFYNGIPVEKINPDRVSLLQFTSNNGKESYEFLTDGSSLFNREYRMTKDDLQYYDLSIKDREKLIKMFFFK